jgi:hypothetical protein
MSITNITYLDQFIPHSMFCFTDSLKTRFYFNDNLEFRQLLLSLTFIYIQFGMLVLTQIVILLYF